MVSKRLLVEFRAWLVVLARLQCVQMCPHEGVRMVFWAMCVFAQLANVHLFPYALVLDQFEYSAYKK
jgi:hypothetical protein